MKYYIQHDPASYSISEAEYVLRTQQDFCSFMDYEIPELICSDEADIASIKTMDYGRVCPVGSVEFVHDYFMQTVGVIPPPINIPAALCSPAFLGRRVAVEKPVAFCTQLNLKEAYIKSISAVKHNNNGYYRFIGGKLFNSYTHEKVIFRNKSLVSECVSFLSEWRVFVYRDGIVAAKNYDGDPFLSPDKTVIESMIKAYAADAPVAYTLDVGVIDKEGAKQTVVVEVHNFYSCGLYGFDGYTVLNMLGSWYSQFYKQVTSKKV